jgi:hypothetical protein
VAVPTVAGVMVAGEAATRTDASYLGKGLFSVGSSWAVAGETNVTQQMVSSARDIVAVFRCRPRGAGMPRIVDSSRSRCKRKRSPYRPDQREEADEHCR